MISIDSQVAFATNRIESKCVCDILTLFATAAAAAAPCVAVLRRAINKAKCSISLGAAYTEHCPSRSLVPACLAPLCVHCVLCWATVIRLDHSTKKLNLHINIIWVLAGLLCLLLPPFWLHFTTLHTATAVVLFIKRKQQQTV